MSGLGTEVGLGAWRGGLGVWELARVRVRKMFGGLGWKYEWAGMNDIFGLAYCSGFLGSSGTVALYPNYP